MPSFEGTQTIILEPDDSNVPDQFEFTVCSASTANDGGIPYGHTITSTASWAKAHRIDGTNMTTGTTGLITATSFTSFTCTAWLTYPTSSGTVGGRYHIKFLPTITDGTTAVFVKEFDFNRVLLKDL